MKVATRSIFKFTDYRSFLSDVLSLMKERNPQFSLRALAKKLDTPPSFLSEVLNGKKSLSLDKALQIGRSLKMDVRETTFLCYLVVLESCTDPDQRKNLLLEISAFSSNDHRKNVDLNIFEVIASWECIAVLELLTIYPHRTINFYANQLGISNSQATTALARLAQVHLVLQTEQGYERTKEELLISSRDHNLALKIYHSSMLEKARNAIYSQSPVTRYTGTETLMIDPELLPEAHAIMNESLDKLLFLLKKSEKKSSLIHIQFNLFELNQSKKKVVS